MLRPRVVLLGVSVVLACGGLALVSAPTGSLPLIRSPAVPAELDRQRSISSRQQLLWRRFVEANFAGDQACAECHREQYEAHQRSGHSHTASQMMESELAKRLLEGGEYQDPRRDQEFRFEARDGRFFVSVADEPGTPPLEVTWLLGSGTHAQTPIAIDQASQSGAELRWTHFAHSGELATTPDHDRFDGYRPGTLECYGRPMDANGLLSCLGCHMTLGPPPGAPLISDLFVANVGCERCHGPRKQHVQFAHLGRPEAHQPLIQYHDAESYVTACAQCHRDETNTLPTAEPHELVRFQPYGLKKSRCYQESPGNLSCSACHDPHDAVSHDRAVYIAQCQSCHQPERASLCTADPAGDCIDCHMPAVEWTAGIAFHDHWIRRPEPSRDSTPSH